MQTHPTQQNSLRSELRDDVKKMTSSATERVQNEFEARKGPAAEQVRGVSSALQSAAGELGNNGAPDWLKSGVERGAQHFGTLADRVENKDPRELLADVNAVARNNPGTFLAGCAALGFAAARVFKAGGQNASASGAMGSTAMSPASTSTMSANPGSTAPLYGGATAGGMP